MQLWDNYKAPLQHNTLKFLGLNMKNSLCKAMIPIFLTGLMIISSIIFSSSQAKGEAASDLLGRYSCSKVKALLESAPEDIFKMWANSGQFGSNSAKATEIIMRGELQ